ncbi:MAG TPA: hypothetical protein VD861_20445 [Pyrinomonadaceae bacterium]|nr:hypothetical protein [Pyrinomonadaceae bacterium]
MKPNVLLTTASLLSILFMSFHHADDVVRGMAPGKFSNLIPVFFLLVWLYGTLVLAGRRAGYVIILVASLLASGIPVVHMRGSGLVGGIAKPGGDFGEFFFVWTLIAAAVAALFSVILSAHGLWGLRRGQSR